MFELTPPPAVIPWLLTDHIMSLDAPDEVLKKRVQALPERVAEKMRCTEAEYIPRLEKFRNAMGAEESVLDYFDELEIHPKQIGTAVRATFKAAILLFHSWTQGGAVPLFKSMKLTLCRGSQRS